MATAENDNIFGIHAFPNIKQFISKAKVPSM